MQNNDTQLSYKDNLDASKDRLSDAFVQLEKVLKNLSSKNTDQGSQQSQEKLEKLRADNTALANELDEVKEKYAAAKALADQVLGELNQSINVIQTTLGKNDNS